MFSHYFFIPIGVVAYFLFFYEDDDFDEMEEKYDYHEDKKIDDAFMPRKFIDVEKNP
ncbi:TPA: hypothetical protein ACXDZY_002697 [Staphylococcus aureus]